MTSNLTMPMPMPMQTRHDPMNKMCRWKEGKLPDYGNQLKFLRKRILSTVYLWTDNTLLGWWKVRVPWQKDGPVTWNIVTISNSLCND